MPHYEVHETFRVARRIQSVYREQFGFVEEIPRRAGKIGVKAFAKASATSVDLIRKREAYEFLSQSRSLGDIGKDKLEARLKNRNRFYGVSMRVFLGDVDIFTFDNGDKVLGLPIIGGKEVVIRERANLYKDIANIAGLSEELAPDFVPMLGLATLRAPSDIDVENLLDFVSDQPRPNSVDVFPLFVCDARIAVEVV